MFRPDPATGRALVVDANDGIIATAGIVEGLAGAGATELTLVVASFAAMLAGGLAMAGAKYGEAASERDALLEVVEEERRQLALSPAEEAAELRDLYQDKGLSPDLARAVADELMAIDPLAAHVEAEHGLRLEDLPKPMTVAVLAGLAFAAGSSLPLLTVLLVPDHWRVLTTFIAVMVSLTLTSLIAARLGRTAVRRTLQRTLTIGALAMLVSLAAGSLLQP